ncbi:sugar phosphate isomerase/epimerase [Schaalia hyovaginalis]|uniref:sugar phosphate isomerase/epimerase family protein n=1 Tax=Schaalia hyovaginalis TaxID=29316 RepID=UPI002A752399|nr:sugar phosphate isomerase/epimerase [Schaalia hyovaginalis]MDY2669191.1 sugar phosphate isomerase/epimerase [Schaalia hyovaginalis]
MKKQNFELRREQLLDQYLSAKEADPSRFERRLNLSWSNWGFGLEELEASVERLAGNGLQYVELHGNHYGPSLGYQVEETRRILDAAGMSVSGVCGMFSDDNDLSSNRPIKQQEALDYIIREARFASEIGGHYLLVVPASCGRPDALDAYEFERSVRALRQVADVFVETGVKAAIEPIRSAEVSIIHTVADAVSYIDAVDHEGVQWINGDVYHMQSEEPDIAAAILEAGDRLVNLHMADSNRCALGQGSMDLDAIIMAAYLVGMNEEGRFITPEPLGPGAGPYPARNGMPDAASLDALVRDSVTYFKEREEFVRELAR